MRKLDNKGNIAIILCLLITALFGFTALAIDIGMVYTERTKLYNAVDAAALAGSLELPNGDDKATSAALNFLQLNNVDSNNAVISISGDHKSIQIQETKSVKHLFAPILGINNSIITVKSKAIIGPLKSIKGGIRPFAVQVFNFSYGDLVTLKEGAGSGYNGNYGAVALGGNGASVFKTNALYGYNGTLSIGDYIDTEPGNMAGATKEISNYINTETSSFSNFPRNSIRLWIIPLVDTLQVNGRKPIQIVGFGQFYVESVGNKSGKIEIQGHFVKYVTNGVIDTSINDTGVYGARLSK